MKLLVTGAGGFIGSHVVEALLKEGHHVRALAHYNGRGSWGYLDGFVGIPHPNLEVCLGDVTDAPLIRSLVDGCDVVLHLAALIGIPYSHRAPGVLCDHQCQWHAKHFRSLPHIEGPQSSNYIYQRSLWNSVLYSD